MNIQEVHKALSRHDGLGGRVYVPEFTWGSLRIDAVIVDTRKRFVHGYEIKVRRSDYLRDTKWTQYAEFCATLSIVCPEDLILPNEVEAPFGLIYVTDYGFLKNIKRAKVIQNRNSLSWLWTYTKILELELPRLAVEVQMLKSGIRKTT